MFTAQILTTVLAMAVTLLMLRIVILLRLVTPLACRQIVRDVSGRIQPTAGTNAGMANASDIQYPWLNLLVNGQEEESRSEVLGASDASDAGMATFKMITETVGSPCTGASAALLLEECVACQSFATALGLQNGTVP